jgi:hypothetical protein
MGVIFRDDQGDGEMTKGISAIVLALAASAALTACSDSPDVQAQSLAQWKAYCAARGKQFLWKDTIVNHDVLMERAQVEGRCVGPGERGYQAPEPPDDRP